MIFQIAARACSKNLVQKWTLNQTINTQFLYAEFSFPLYQQVAATKLHASINGESRWFNLAQLHIHYSTHLHLAIARSRQKKIKTEI